MANYQPVLDNWPTLPRAGLATDFSQNTAATHTVVAAVAGRRIRVLSAEFYVDGAQVLTWKSGADAINGGVFELGTSGYTSLGPHYGQYLETRSGEALGLQLGSAIRVRGPVVYQYV
mgnify:CR=1 FL=1